MTKNTANITSTIPPTTPPAFPTIVEASVIINRPYSEVCNNASTFMDRFCDGVKESKPGDRFLCEIQSIDNIPCPLGVCTCVALHRRLLQESCTLVIVISGTSTPSLTHLPIWVLSATIKEPQKTTTTHTVQPSDNSGLIIIIVAITLSVTAFIVVYTRRPMRTLPHLYHKIKK